MERFKLACNIGGNTMELQFDLKKMPDNAGSSYMVSVDGVFKGYITKNNYGSFERLGNSGFTDEDLLVINQKLAAKLPG